MLNLDTIASSLLNSAEVYSLNIGSNFIFTQVGIIYQILGSESIDVKNNQTLIPEYAIKQPLPKVMVDTLPRRYVRHHPPAITTAPVILQIQQSQIYYFSDSL